MKESKYNKALKIKIISLTIYLLAIFVFEMIYRNYLFDKSLIWEKNFQESEYNSYDSFFRIITEFGAKITFLPMLLLVFYVFPLNKSYLFFSILLYANYLVNTFKMFYGSPRPSWIDSTLNKACDGGYGNPSGHSFCSMATYLSLWHICTDNKFFVTKRIFRSFLLLCTICLIAMIMTSRIYLGVHSINQILFGMSLGFALYYLFFHIISLQKLHGKAFFDLFASKKNNLLFFLLFSILIFIACFIYLHVETERDDSQWENILKYTCSSINTKLKSFKKEGLYSSLAIFALFGMHYGVTFIVFIARTKYTHKDDFINAWNKTSFSRQIFRLIIVIVFASPILLHFAMPIDSEFIAVMTLKYILPFYLVGFSLFGFSVFLSVIAKLSNPKIYELGTTHTHTQITELDNHFVMVDVV